MRLLWLPPGHPAMWAAMRAAVQWLAGLRGWRRLAVAAGAGASCALAMAPLHAAPILLIALPVLIWLMDGVMDEVESESPSRWRAARRAGMVGWAFGFGWFLAGLTWISEAFLVEAEVFAWLAPFAVVLLPAGLALFTAAATAAAAALSWPSGGRRVVVMAAALTAAEWLRGHIFTGFPWNLPAQATGGIPALMQPAALVGVYGLSLAVLLVAASPAALMDGRRHGPTHASRRHWPVPVFALCLTAAAWIWGDSRLAMAPSDGAESGDNATIVRLVQPNVAQKDKWRGDPQEELRTLTALSILPLSGRMAEREQPDVVIWPEASVPFLFDGGQSATEALAVSAGEGILLAGALRRTPSGALHNSILAIDGNASAVRASYDKVRLVPFGEYLPARGLFAALGLRQLAQRGDIVAGADRNLITLPGLPPLGMAVCYEVIFPGVAPKGAEWLVNVTNDAWFGLSAGPRQHLDQARMRAVETGIPVARAANGGISAMIDAYGRTPSMLGLNQRGVVDAFLPPALSPTLYRRLGDGPVLAALAGLWIAALAIRRRRPAPPLDPPLAPPLD